MPPLRLSVWTAAALLGLCSGCYSPMFNGGYRSPYYGGAYGGGYGAPYGGASYGYPVGGQGIQTLPPGGEYIPGAGGTPTYAPGTLTPVPDGSNGGNSDAPEYDRGAAPGNRPVPTYPEGGEQPGMEPPVNSPVKESNSGASLETTERGPWGGDVTPAASEVEEPVPRRLDPINTENAEPMGETVQPAEEAPSDLLEPTSEAPLSTAP